MQPQTTIDTTAASGADAPEDLEAYNMYIALTDANKRRVEQFVKKLRLEQEKFAD